ncbi:hypothetical protein C2G38_2176044 [Gigaspora rosea]|uniref:Uncharacterized protein n=1 Tax=Gigaspora rosea TaxID=44941 RepID=A0A397VIJ3_9GLOM|nr:hypothetical protein C2G38_2176044 [Gigaspora rosea]
MYLQSPLENSKLNDRIRKRSAEFGPLCKDPHKNTDEDLTKCQVPDPGLDKARYGPYPKTENLRSQRENPYLAYIGDPKTRPPKTKKSKLALPEQTGYTSKDSTSKLRNQQKSDNHLAKDSTRKLHKRQDRPLPKYRRRSKTWKEGRTARMKDLVELQLRPPKAKNIKTGTYLHNVDPPTTRLQKYVDLEKRRRQRHPKTPTTTTKSMRFKNVDSKTKL